MIQGKRDRQPSQPPNKACSAEAFEAWYESYLADVSPVSRPPRPSELFDNELDVDETEQRVQDQMPTICIANGLCLQCQHILHNWPEPPTQTQRNDELNNQQESVLKRVTWTFHKDTIALEASSRNGCRLCGALVQRLLANDYLGHYRRIEQRVRRLDSTTTLSMSSSNYCGDMYLWLDMPGKRGLWFRYCFTNFEARPHALSANDPGLREVLLSRQPESIFDKVRYWQSTCSEQHPRCHSGSTDLLPTRLLRIDRDPHLPRLVITADHVWSQRPAYATLSHCWGGGQFTCLRDDNLKTFATIGIPVTSLTKTFQDAIVIAREAGLDFIWIDSLSIIQGNESDWTKEAMTMHLVYSHSALNIAASSAQNGEQGCFLKPEFFSGGFYAECITGSQRMLRSFHDPVSRYDQSYQDAITWSHLASRGWCFQERALAPRTLHCGNMGFWWECRELIASEFFPRGYPFPSDIEEQSFLPEGPRTAAMDADSWKEIVNTYSKAELTYSKDKLVALGGLAKAAQVGNGFDYLAGLWRPFLEDLLFWHARGGLHGLRPVIDRAPSWSWAAVDGQIAFGNQLMDAAHVLDVSVTPMAGNDCFGQIAGGTLTLCCSHLVRGSMSRWIFADSWARMDFGNFTIGRSSYFVEVDLDFLLEPHLADEEVVLVLFSKPSETSSKGACLVLQPTGNARGEYRRIGTRDDSTMAPRKSRFEEEEMITVADGDGLSGDIVLSNLFAGIDEPCELLADVWAEMPQLACEAKSEQHAGEPFVITII